MTTSSEPSESIENDYFWMAKALRLAEKGRYTTSPNPNVGCIIVNRNNQQVGQGYHLKAGSPHAEVHALEEAGEQAQGATAYVTLEPCSHYGRTPPCAKALVKAQVARVVVAMTDPNPKVSGRGIAMLQNAGIQVSSGVMAAQAAALNTGFIKRMVTGKPWVSLKLAISLDGKIALSNGQSQWITGADARRDVQRYRALSCAVMTGSGTAIADDPSLLVRPAQAALASYPLKRIRQPVRVVIDRDKTLPDNLQLFTDGFPTWRVVSDEQTPSADDLPFAVTDKKINLSDVLQTLAKKNINRLFVEAGPGLAGALLEAGEVDELIIYQAPKILGDKARSMVRMPDFASLDQVVNLTLHQQTQVGDDLKLVFRVAPSEKS
ncbi:bifunctional diaminohydroxyphosphoribosylaminopyrimidine deaminase/5-amino-6-(5-phosphoribosylamino)uracil reductase RibD [Salinimonas sp. HHU 13199]|uniref:Riboflavin biosynthesis protein RibD n=1 Tax=Salinimonas profundi TaxID=2729140 RepID=A0ABR8LM92_9ALTE|nr:bifunctional diaminohydroxyphosphoribosylaminopyrimidine deaminase/5-amino-6-(5-phosphoribosylamino)uracil reductase RibD [Salinimonas profundi]MBD3587326.1 bifunctional diaminohydroxyphosphoribosylaminopyrimidine deaminase/5-amino-6-(5-phosphoribosylamino)uracil reductase RibD [Salinimonas profundi]